MGVAEIIRKHMEAMLAEVGGKEPTEEKEMPEAEDCPECGKAMHGKKDSMAYMKKKAAGME